MKSRPFGILVLLLALAVLAGCGGGSGTVTVTERIETSVTETTGHKGGEAFEANPVSEFCSSPTWAELEVLENEIENAPPAELLALANKIGDLAEKAPPGAYCATQSLGNAKSMLGGYENVIPTLKRLQNIEQTKELTPADGERISAER
ncbi:MAG TPA: hypothetical protein VHS74_05625 [Solirubrobacterales bacterium]|jgi:hypothetical protein|nr:hypothetical protein [Solirubrobacterales bacterium]